ncbi:hypothetical protein C8Q80DRAFT_1155194 [Daedaleopsis nitida]|nr:hypothetical protein C8Q80DRAFT_1155194 [Daedaleopsis nitida]
MPVAVSASSSKPAKALERSYSNPIPRKRRAVKRRGRGKDEFESDDEIEREVRTDSETDDDNSSIDSDSDSESASSDLHADAHSEVRHRQSPSSSHGGIFADATNWAEMVAGEAENGAAELPVIDFADMDASRLQPSPPSPAPRSRKAHRANKKASATRATSAPPPPAPATVSQPEPSEGAPEEDEPIASTSHEQSHSEYPIRQRGQSARQAYQQRLETDPSFVPKVGEFWGHDDRLLDKNLRSLSGWWRGRWQTRGRGRGAFNMRGRGRGFYPGQPFHQEEGGEPQDAPVDVPPVERTWTHDGFEEMKRRDERRRAVQEQQQAGPVHHRGFGFRGRGFVPARGRGGFGRGASFSPTTTPTSQRAPASTVSMGDRVWYAQKPERMWTKQHDIFLYNDPSTRPRPGVGPGVKVRLPGGKAPLIVRLPPRTGAARAPEIAGEVQATQPEAEKVVTVRLPVPAGKANAVEEPSADVPGPVENASTVEDLSLEEVFTVRPNAVPNRRLDLTLPSSSPVASAQHLDATALPTSPATDEIRTTIEQLTTLPVVDGRSSPSAQIQETILRNPPASEEISAGLSTEESQSRPAPPVLHPLQTSFSPAPPPTSPPYGSSPYAYGPPLPPGVGVNHQGMPYEYATGRPVYIQPTPPPMYTPRPMMHAHHPSMTMPFVPSHLRHHSTASPDFLAHPHTPHTPPIASFVDPNTGSSRIEIRAPTDAGDGKKASRPSHQRSNLSTSVASVPADETHIATYYPHAAPSEETAPTDEASHPPHGHAHTPSMDSTPYYYPEQYGYPYPTEHQHHQHPPSQPVVYY